MPDGFDTGSDYADVLYVGPEYYYNVALSYNNESPDYESVFLNNLGQSYGLAVSDDAPSSSDDPASNDSGAASLFDLGASGAVSVGTSTVDSSEPSGFAGAGNELGAASASWGQQVGAPGVGSSVSGGGSGTGAGAASPAQAAYDPSKGVRPGDPAYDFGLGLSLLGVGTGLSAVASPIGWAVTWSTWGAVSSLWNDGLDWHYAAWKGIDVLEAPTALDVSMTLGTGLVIFGGLAIIGGFIDAAEEMQQDPQINSLFDDTPCFEDPTYPGCP